MTYEDLQDKKSTSLKTRDIFCIIWIREGGYYDA